MYMTERKSGARLLNRLSSLKGIVWSQATPKCMGGGGGLPIIKKYGDHFQNGCQPSELKGKSKIFTIL